MGFTIYHNPRCRKSREALALLSDHSSEITIVEYLTHPPTAAALKSILKKLNISAEQSIRKGEADYNLNYKGKQLSEDEWIAAMIAHPKLIERPIVIKGDRAVIGRPPAAVRDLF